MAGDLFDMLGLSWILNRHKGALYMVFVLSFGWGLIPWPLGTVLVVGDGRR